MSPYAGQLLVDEIVPRITAVIPRSVKLVGCEDVQEVTQDCIAMAARILDNAERAGKKVTVGNIAYYALQHIKSGRRSVGNSVVDVLATGTQLHGKCVVESLEMLVSVEDDDGGIPVGEMVSRDTEDPATIAGREVDWSRFQETQGECSNAIVTFIAEGRKLHELRRERGFSYEKVRETRKKLQSDVLQFFGRDVLADAGRRPAWKAGMMATRERHAGH